MSDMLQLVVMPGNTYFPTGRALQSRTNRTHVRCRIRQRLQLLIDSASLAVLRQSVDNFKSGLGRGGVFAITPQAFFSKPKMALRYRNLVRMFRDLIPKRLQVAHLLGLREVLKPWRCGYGSIRHSQMITGAVQSEQRFAVWSSILFLKEIQRRKDVRPRSTQLRELRKS